MSFADAAEKLTAIFHIGTALSMLTQRSGMGFALRVF